MARAFAVPLAAVLLAALLLDPYSWVAYPSDCVGPEPWWRSPLALTDAAMCLAAGGLLWAHRARAAWHVLAAELGFALAIGLGVIHRGLVAEFLLGATFPFDMARGFSLYLATFVLRLILLATVRVLPGEAVRRAT